MQLHRSPARIGSTCCRRSPAGARSRACVALLGRALAFVVWSVDRRLRRRRTDLLILPAHVAALRGTTSEWVSAAGAALAFVLLVASGSRRRRRRHRVHAARHPPGRGSRRESRLVACRRRASSPTSSPPLGRVRVAICRPASTRSSVWSVWAVVCPTCSAPSIDIDARQRISLFVTAVITLGCSPSASSPGRSCGTYQWLAVSALGRCRRRAVSSGSGDLALLDAVDLRSCRRPSSCVVRERGRRSSARCGKSDVLPLVLARKLLALGFGDRRLRPAPVEYPAAR